MTSAFFVYHTFPDTKNLIFDFIIIIIIILVASKYISMVFKMKIFRTTTLSLKRDTEDVTYALLKICVEGEHFENLGIR